MKKLDKKVIKLWIVRNLFFVIPVLVGYILLIALIPNNLKLSLGLSCGLVVLLITSLALIWPFLSYHFYEYSYDETKIFINYGVIFRHKILVPVCQIQDLHLYNGPLMQLFKLSGIILSTAGSNFSLSGISKDEANLMIFDLENKLEERVNHE